MLPRFEHILVPVDFTGKNLAALEIAFEMAQQNQARTSLLHVVEQIDVAPDGDDELDRFYAQLQRRADSDLEALTQRFSGSGLEVEHKVRIGKRVREIVRFVEEHNVDLVVLSSHPLDPDQPGPSMATVSYQVSLFCRCPVLMVKQDDTMEAEPQDNSRKENA
jgi:nucleotide-binding universal stress UspA family protein